MKTSKIELKNKINEIEPLHQQINELGQKWNLPENIIFNIDLCLEELVTNIIKYGYNDKNDHQIDIHFYYNDEIEIIIIDDGKAFDPLKYQTQNIDSSLEERNIGGLGIHFVRNIMDDISYERKEDQNILRMRKRL